jgi:hypothetical protein
MIASWKFVSSLVQSTLSTSLDHSNAITFFARASRRFIIRYHHCHDFCAFAYVFACVFLCMFVCMLFSLLSPLLSPSCIFCVSDRASEKDCVRRGLLGARGKWRVCARVGVRFADVANTARYLSPFLFCSPFLHSIFFSERRGHEKRRGALSPPCSSSPKSWFR